MPKRGCDINKNEIVRFFKLHATKIEPISFTVPRKSELFQPDIFPPTASNEPSLSCEDWWDGQNANPIPFDLSTLHTGGSGGNTSNIGPLTRTFFTADINLTNFCPYLCLCCSQFKSRILIGF